MKLIELFLYLFFMAVPIKQSLHMFQQNRYRRDRYLPWLKEELSTKHKEILRQLCGLLLFYGLFFVDAEELPYVLLGMVLLIYGYLSLRQEGLQDYRKPLIFTARAKRLCLVQVVLLAFVLGVLLYGTFGFWWIFFTPYLYFLPWISILVSATLLYPVEAALQQRYMKKAKSRLAALPDLTIVAMTGSYGKTSVKNILEALLHDTWYTLATPLSFNNRMGITRTILEQLRPLHELFLCEMGADHVHEIEELMQFVQPQYGIVTAVGPQHLATFHSMDNILHEKMQMIEQLRKDGVGFLNADNEYIRSYPLRDCCRIVWFGKDILADYRYGDVRYDVSGTSFTIAYHGSAHTFHTKLLGEHNVINITCAVAVAHTMKKAWTDLQAAVEQLPYVSHRLEKKEGSRYTILDDAYNANPYGARCALDVLRAMPTQRILVTPGMIDLGNLQDRENERLGEYAATCADEVVLVGPLQTRSLANGLNKAGFPFAHLHIVKSIQEAFALLDKIASKEAVVLLENDLPDAFNH